LKLIYIAGPYRAATPWEVEANVRRAEALALEVWRLNAVPVCPHTMSRYFYGSIPEPVALAGCCALLARCDAVIVIPGWEASAGTVKEIDHAGFADIPVFDGLTRLAIWLKENQDG
jgi:hypothetical protein